MSCSNHHRLLRTLHFASVAAVLAAIAGCKGPDASTFACNSSAECPGDYHCDLGTASTAGTFKCVSGAPTPRALAADATKFLLLKRPSADGSTRTTISANVGAVTSTPDFVGVRLIASQGGKDLANSPVASDGSVLQFQLPQATAQVSLRVLDDSGHSVPVTGYPEQVELSFVGREVAGTTNGAAAFDVGTVSDSLYPPATWITNGPGLDGGVPAQFNVNDTLFPDGGVQFANSYSSIAYLDYHSAAGSTPAAPTDAPAGAVGGTPIGWQPYLALATSDSAPTPPAARIGATIIQQQVPFGSGFHLYGGVDASGAPVDAPGAVYSFSPSVGWTLTQPAAGAAAVPSTGVRSGAALGGSGFQSCTVPCTQLDYRFTMVGGLVPGSTTPSNGVVAFGTQTDLSAAGAVVATRTGWFDAPAVLPFRNAGMASASALISVGTSANPSPGNLFSGVVMVGGQGVNLTNNDSSACFLFAGLPNQFFTSTTLPASNSFFSCTDANWAAGAGVAGGPSIGFRAGMAVVTTTDFSGSPSTLYVFGGRRSGGPAGTDGVKNDLWKGVITCPPIVGAQCTPKVSWTALTPAVPAGAPAARLGAGAAAWNGITSGRFVLYGGTNAANQVLTDAWEFDPNPVSGANGLWRPITAEAAALVPAARSQFAMAGDGTRAYLFGGNIGTTPTDQVWFGTRESVARILTRFPFSLPAMDQATSMKLTVDAAGMPNAQAFVWDGTNWRALGTSVFEGGGFHLLKTPTAAATGFVQTDGNIYVLLMQNSRQTPGSSFNIPVSIDRLKVTVDFK